MFPLSRLPLSSAASAAADFHASSHSRFHYTPFLRAPRDMPSFITTFMIDDY
jgi:hypothetical protein